MNKETAYIFSSKEQWNIRAYLRYYWYRLLRNKVFLCDGVDDQEEIQQAIDSSMIITIIDGEYDIRGSLRGRGNRTELKYKGGER